MAERIVDVGVPTSAFLEIEARKNSGDTLAAWMLKSDVDDLIKQLFIEGLLEDGDYIDVNFYPDDNVTWDSQQRLIKISQLIRDDQDEQIVGKITTEVVIEHTDFREN